jgi:hypothetical protein
LFPPSDSKLSGSTAWKNYATNFEHQILRRNQSKAKDPKTKKADGDDTIPTATATIGKTDRMGPKQQASVAAGGAAAAATAAANAKSGAAPSSSASVDRPSPISAIDTVAKAAEKLMNVQQDAIERLKKSMSTTGPQQQTSILAELLVTASATKSNKKMAEDDVRAIPSLSSQTELSPLEECMLTIIKGMLSVSNDEGKSCIFLVFCLSCQQTRILQFVRRARKPS